MLGRNSSYYQSIAPLWLVPISLWLLWTTTVTRNYASTGRRQNGNLDAAADLYGLGVRLGAYFQLAGMLMRSFRDNQTFRVGLLLLSSTLHISQLISWTLLISHRDISTSEGWLVLIIINVYGTSGPLAESGNTSEGIGILLVLVSEIWETVSSMWFFSTLYRELPLLGTANDVWFFARVDISGWFRVLMLIYSSIKCLLLAL